MCFCQCCCSVPVACLSARSCNPTCRVYLLPPPPPSLLADEPKEIKTLYKRFRRLDRANRGTISGDDLTMIPELCMNPLASRITGLFERDVEDRINFRSFVAGLSMFGPSSSRDVKLKAAFRVFDVDSDGFISETDLKRVVNLMVGKTLSPETAARIITSTLQDADFDKDGKIGPSDFEASLGEAAQALLCVHVKGNKLGMSWEGSAAQLLGGGQQPQQVPAN